jgi:uncharacterized protein (DUF305 family)
MKKYVFIASALAAILSLSVHGVLADSQISPIQDIYAPAMHKMHQEMMITPTGNADIDFVKGMIPHHQGAIDMAKILQAHGKDPELQKLAADIIAAQEKEIAFMQEWLKKHTP